MSEEEQQQPQPQPEEEPSHEHKWIEINIKRYSPTKGDKTRNAHAVTKIHYQCEICGKRKIDRKSPHVIDTEKETVFM
jgi:ribosomal protein L32